MLSFATAKLGKAGDPKTFEDWITQKFGRKLYETFFKTYTEKVWGIPCSQIGAEWAAQRIKGLDIVKVLKNSLMGGKGNKIKTLVDQFDYPVLGAGQMYEAMAETVSKKGVHVLLGAKVTGIHRKDFSIASIDVQTADGRNVTIQAGQYFNSIPLTHFFKMLTPSAGEEENRAAGALYYREHITVDLLIEGTDLFPDQWIYVHSPDVNIARIANYNNFSKEMSGAKNRTGLSVEYFVFQHEDLWKKSDKDLIALAIDEMSYLGLIQKERVQQAWVVRETESYPTYYIGFQEPYDILKNYINRFTNLYPIGRGGMYKYNNQDHSTMSGILAARNFLKLPGTPYSLWDINIDAEYHESAERKND
jgi:protoporphyrinogen oxidase